MTYDLVQISFLDHAQVFGEDTEPVKCTVWGLLIKECDEYFRVMTWGAEDDPSSINSESYVILRSAVTHVVTLRQVTWP